MARYSRATSGVKLSKVKRGIAILEGAYHDDDKQAFYLAGFEVCSTTNLAETLMGMGLATGVSAEPVTPIAEFMSNDTDEVASSEEVDEG